MREALRGYATAVLERAEREGGMARVHDELSGFADALADGELRPVLTDAGLGVETRRDIVRDLLSGRADSLTVRLVAYAVSVEPVADLLASVGWLATRSSAEAAGGEPRPEPLAGRSGTEDRVAGYATATFEGVPEPEIAEIEDEVFRFARTLEGSDELRLALTNAELPLDLRVEIISDLLGGASHRTTLELAAYALRAGRARDLIMILDWITERAAIERNMRVAEVRTPVPLDESQRARLADALGRVVDRQVELRVVVDPSLIGGVMALIGDTVIDGSIRRRLDQLRSEMVLARG